MDSKKIPTRYGTAIIVIIALTVGALVWRYEMKKQESFDSSIQQIESPKEEQKDTNNLSNTEGNKHGNETDDDTTEDVTFCGKTYESDKLIINETDIISKIAKISEKNSWICKNMELGKFQESGIGISQKKNGYSKYLVVLFNKGNQREESDPFNQSPDIFRFDFNSNKVYYQSQIDAKFNEIGNIK